MQIVKAKGIDISKWQTQRGKIDFAQVKGSGNAFVMVRLGWAGYAGELHKDPDLDAVLREAAGAGLHVGLYVYAYTKGAGAARVCAREAVAFAKKHVGIIDYPIALDVEETADTCLLSQGKAGLTDTICAFCSEVGRLGYYPMWYTYSAFVQQYLDMARLEAYDFWQADYRPAPWECDRGIWQYIGDEGRCPGVIGACDNNYSYVDYAALIRSRGYNGFPADGCGPSVPRSQYDALKEKHGRLLAQLKKLVSEELEE